MRVSRLGHCWRLIVVTAVLMAATPAMAQFEPRVGMNFRGGTLGINSGFIPPDTMGTVGKDHVVQLINGHYGVWDKSTGTKVQSLGMRSFWGDAFADFSGGPFDPRITYDPATERYYAASVDNAGSDNNFLVGVSETSDPTEGWSGFAIESDPQGRRWADFPQMGFDRDHVYVSANMFDQDDDDVNAGFAVNAVAVDKQSLLTTPPIGGGRSPGLQFDRLEDISAITGGSAQPTVDRDNSGQRSRIFSQGGGGQLELSTYATPRGEPLGTTVADLPDINVPFRGAPPDADQPADVDPLDSGGRRIRSAVKRVNGSFWGVQSVRGPRTGNAAVRFFEVDAQTNELLQEGVVSDPQLDMIFPSIAVNKNGQAVIGFTGSSDEQVPSAYAVVGQMNEDGELEFGEEILLEAGDASYERLVGNRNRWGDYSATVVDPENPGEFWTFQEFAFSDQRGEAITDRWSTQISQVIIPTPSTGVLLALGVGLLGRRRRQPAG